VTESAAPLIELTDVVRSHGALRPLRVKTLRIVASDQVVLAGFDGAAAEAFVHLVIGATLPDEGTVRIAGTLTTEVAADTAWLSSLDRFGLVTDRALLLGALSIAANLAIPLTLLVDPMAPEVRQQVEALADAIELPRARLDESAGSLSAAERIRVHLARALAVRPEVLLLEHPTAALDGPDEGALFGALLAKVTGASECGWVALSEDRAFAEASGGRRLRLTPATGDLVRDDGGWRRWFGRG
jgi:ABC-type transporter Mla maintaining outer membrane lipid asymmetry ATPase subunit MlaF